MIADSISLRNYKELIEAMQIPCALTDDKGEINFCNNLFLKSYSLDKSKKVGKIFNFDFHPHVENNIVALNENRSLQSVEFKLGNKKYYLIFILDYLVKKQLASDIKLLNHDLNNILTSILNSALTFKQNFQNEQFEKAIANIENGVHRASSILESFLSPESIISSANKNIDLVKLVNEVINSLSALNKGKAKIEFNYKSSVKISGDYNQIFRAIQNICINAIESINVQGNIQINISSAKKFEIKDFDVNKKYVKVTIKDNGCGIKKSDVKKIFDEGFSTKKKAHESGLGLSGVKKIVAAHNGLIDVKSAVNKGTEFSLFLPALEESESILRNQKRKIKIIVADDEDNILELLTDLFLSYNFEVASAKDGNEVLSILKKDASFDFLVIDRKMPQLDGIECIRKIRKTKNPIKIILTTGSPSVKLDSTLLKKLGVDEIISKPYDFNYLLETVSRIIASL